MMILNPYHISHFDFCNEIAIVCPECNSKAFVHSPGLFEENTDMQTFCVCINCGYIRKYAEKAATRIIKSNGQTDSFRVKILTGEIDPFFHRPLWYLTSCSLGTVWAYNFLHLQVIEDLIRFSSGIADASERKSTSIASRIPKWMIEETNREHVLECIESLKKK